MIFISVTYGKGPDGRLRYNFGPINGENGWRRLNILASRARRRMKVFSSIRAEDISLVGLTSNGARLLRSFLAYAETRQIEQTEISQAAETDSPFERDVFFELTRLGVNLVSQVGVAGYRVDFGVLDDNHPGRYICGIECDGVTYHASETARDRDHLRQQVLEDRGWIIYRIWSTDWFKDRQSQVARIMDSIQQAREKTRSISTSKDMAESGDTDVSLGMVEEASGAIEQYASQSVLLGEPATGANPDKYSRPKVQKYRIAKLTTLPRRNILDSSVDEIVQVVTTVVNEEAPIHFDELVDRIVSHWSTRAGKRIVERIEYACTRAIPNRMAKRKGDFFYSSRRKIPVRCRDGWNALPEHISPDEYRETTLLVLNSGYAFPRNVLINEVRAILGFGRTTATLDTLIGNEIDDLLAQKVVGDPSSGIALRS